MTGPVPRSDPARSTPTVPGPDSTVPADRTAPDPVGPAEDGTDRAAPRIGSRCSGPDASAGDAEIVAAARRLFLDRSMIRPGPGFLPVGARARRRRDHRTRIDQELTSRRQELTRLLRTRRPAPRPASGSAVATVTHRFVVTVLAVAVGIVMVVASLAGRSNPPPPTHWEPVTGPVTRSIPGVGNTSTATPSAATRTDGSVSGGAAVRPGLVAPDLSTPGAAAVSWLLRWCPFDYRQDPTTRITAARVAMTDTGWAQFSTEKDSADTAAGWAGIVASRATGRCTDLRAAVSLQAPRTATGVVVVVTATRTVTTTGLGSYQEPVTRQQQVLRGGDGGWRVDVAAGGA